MRSAKEESCFPYTSKRVCFIEVSADGTVQQVSCSKLAIEEACSRVRENNSSLYAVWPGNYRSDLFVIDDIDALSDAYGIEREKQHRHIVEYALSSFDDGRSTYASVELTFKCGCEMDLNNIKAIAGDLKKQFGWDMATTTGFGACISKEKTTYSVRIRRSSLLCKNRDRI